MVIEKSGESNNPIKSENKERDDANREPTDEELADYYIFHINFACATPDGGDNVRREWIQLARNILDSHKIKNPAEEKRLKECIDKYEKDNL